jgi:hypothetical protein
METIAGFGIIIVIAVAYFIPAMIAGVRGHNNTVAIFAFNLFLGWSFIGWVFAFVWALTSNVKKA